MEFVDLGKIVSTHGVRGEVKVLPFTNDFERFKKLKKVYIRTSLSDYREVDVLGCKILKTTVALNLAGVISCNDAEKLRNMIISIDKKDVPKLPTDSYYVFDLIGCEIFSSSDGEMIGTIKDVIQTGANDVYLVKDTDGDDIMIPAVKEFINSIDIENKKISVTLPTGLLDIYKRNDINDDL